MQRSALPRRTFLVALAIGAGATFVAGCGGDTPTVTNASPNQDPPTTVAGAGATKSTVPPASATGTRGTANAGSPVASPASSPTRGPAPRTLTGTSDGLPYRIAMPDNWNRTLVLYNQGGLDVGQAREAPEQVSGAALLARGYALAGSAFTSGTDWPVERALQQQIALLDLFARQIGTPDRTVTWGDSMGGLITAGLAQRYPGRLAGAMPMCGLLGGSVGAVNTFLDFQFAFKVLLAPDDPGLPLVNLGDSSAVTRRALAVLDAAQQSPVGRARVALAAAFGQVADWLDPARPRPAPTDHAGRQQNQAAWLRFFVMSLWLDARAAAERRAGGSPAFNIGVSYRDLFSRAPQRDLVEALYAQAALDLDADLRAIDDTPRVAADSGALDYLRRNISLDGRLAVPVLTLHTTADGAAPVAFARAFGEAARATGNERLVRQVYVDRPGHCLFTPAERLATFAQLIRRLDTGAWDDAALTPDALNAAATALGTGADVPKAPDPAPTQNPAPAAAAFVPFSPPPSLRPFDQ